MITCQWKLLVNQQNGKRIIIKTGSCWKINDYGCVELNNSHRDYMEKIKKEEGLISLLGDGYPNNKNINCLKEIFMWNQYIHIYVSLSELNQQFIYFLSYYVTIIIEGVILWITKR